MTSVNNNVFSKPFLKSLFINQNHYHKYGVLLHTIKVMIAVIKAKDYKYLAAAFMHDFGKPYVAYQDDEDILVGEYSFTDHEEKSFQIIKNWSFVSTWTKDIVRFHYIIRDLKNSKRKGNFKRYAMLKEKWDKLDKKFIEELEQFMIYDDYGKS